MKNKKYVLIHLPLKDKPIKRFYETVSEASYNYPEATCIELFNVYGIKLASISKQNNVINQ